MLVRLQYLVVVAAAALVYLEIYPWCALRLFGREHALDGDTPRMRD